MKKRLLTLMVVIIVLVATLAVSGHAATSDYVNLEDDVDIMTITEDTKLCLCGYTIDTLTVEKGVTLYLDGSIGGAVGKINGGGTVVLEGRFLEFIDKDNNCHTLILDTAGVSLRMGDLKTEGASTYYTSTFGGDQYIKDQIVAYGLALGAGKAPNFADKTFTRRTDLSGWKTDKEFNDNGVLLKGIMKSGNTLTVNKGNAQKEIYNVAYVELADGTRITSSVKNTNLKKIAETASALGNGEAGYWNTLSAAQKETLFKLYESFEAIVKPWNTQGVDVFKENTATSYDIYSAGDLAMMAKDPSMDYVLKANIDMKGATIDGATNFTGSINGGNYKVSNFTVNGVGLVDTVASGESITNLKLENVKVVVPADATATAVGTIAGTNNGTISGSYATGSVKDTRANIKMGALVGENKGTITTTTFTDKIVVDTFKTDGSGIGNDNTTYSTTGLAAAVGLFNDAEGVTKALIGTNSGTVKGANGETLAAIYWRDSAYSTEKDAKTLQNRRQTVVDDVFAQGTLRWTVPSTITYYNDQKNQPSFNKGDREWVQTGKWPWQGEWQGKYHIHNQQFNPGTVYNGIPYAHTSSTIEQAKFYMTQNSDGVYVLNSDIASIKGGSDNATGNATWANGGIGWAKYLGSDCSAALTMAWHKVTTIRDLNRTEANKGVCLYYTTNIVPTEFNQWNYGFVKVGDYTVNDKALATAYELTGTDFTTSDKKQTKTNYPINTNMIVEDIIANQGGINTVYEAYAKAQMGDIMISSGTAGHTRMLALDPVVIRNGNGVIDPAKSYFVTHEQGDGLYERAETLSSWRINYKYTFEQLAYQNIEGLTGSSGYYLPITMHAFHDTSVASSGQVTLSGGRAIGTTNDPSYVVINSSFRIQSATMTIMDAPNGNVLYQKTAFQGTSSSGNRYRAVPGNITMWMNEFFSDYGANLTPGTTYYFTLSGTTYTNATPKNVYTNEAFVYTPAA